MQKKFQNFWTSFTNFNAFKTKLEKLDTVQDSNFNRNPGTFANETLENFYNTEKDREVGWEDS